MYLVFGQFWNQTRLTWDWQQIGSPIPDIEDAKSFASEWSRDYGVNVKLVGRATNTMYLPPDYLASLLRDGPMRLAD